MDSLRSPFGRHSLRESVCRRYAPRLNPHAREDITGWIRGCAAHPAGALRASVVALRAPRIKPDKHADLASLPSNLVWKAGFEPNPP